MYQVLKNRLLNATYTLADATARIEWGVAKGALTVAQAAELTGIAELHADPNATDVTLAEVAARQDQLEGAILELADLVGLLAAGETVTEDDVVEGGETV